MRNLFLEARPLNVEAPVYLKIEDEDLALEYLKYAQVSSDVPVSLIYDEIDSGDGWFTYSLDEFVETINNPTIGLQIYSPDMK